MFHLGSFHQGQLSHRRDDGDNLVSATTPKSRASRQLGQVLASALRTMFWKGFSIQVKADLWDGRRYGFTLAAYAAGLGHVDLSRDLMAQPPWDFEASRFNILHYT